MAGGDDLEFGVRCVSLFNVLCVCVGRVNEDRTDAFELLREDGDGLVCVELGEDFGAERERGCMNGHSARHRNEDAVDLGLFVVEQARELVVLLDRLHWLEVDGLAAGAGAVKDAADFALELGLDGDDEALAAHGDEVALRFPAFAELCERLAEAFLDDAVLAGEGAADACEFGGGVVGERTVGLDLAAKRAQQVAEVVLDQRSRECLDCRPVVLEVAGRLGDELTPGIDALGVGEQREESRPVRVRSLRFVPDRADRPGRADRGSRRLRRSRQAGASRRCAAAAGRSIPRRRWVRVPAPGPGRAGSVRRRPAARAGVPTRAQRLRARLACRECSGCRPQSLLEPIVAYRVEPIVPRPAARG